MVVQIGHSNVHKPVECKLDSESGKQKAKNHFSHEQAIFDKMLAQLICATKYDDVDRKYYDQYRHDRGDEPERFGFGRRSHQDNDPSRVQKVRYAQWNDGELHRIFTFDR